MAKITLTSENQILGLSQVALEGKDYCFNLNDENFCTKDLVEENIGVASYFTESFDLPYFEMNTLDGQPIERWH